MLTIQDCSENELIYTVAGTLSAQELEDYYQHLEEQYARVGKLNLLVSVHDFRGYQNLAALRVFVLNEPKLLFMVARYALIGDQLFFKFLLPLLNLIPNLRAKRFSSESSMEAKKWLRVNFDK